MTPGGRPYAKSKTESATKRSVANGMIRTPMDRAENSLSIDVQHSRKDPCFLSAPSFCRADPVMSTADATGRAGTRETATSRSPRIGQIERQIADLQKERKIPRLLTVFALTFVSYTQRNSPEKSHDDDDGGTPAGRHRSPKRTKRELRETGVPAHEWRLYRKPLRLRSSLM